MTERKNKNGLSEFFGIAGIKEFSYDEDINDIVNTLDLLVKQCGLSSVRSWTSYQDCPEMGDCMVYDIRYDLLPEGFLKEIVKCKLEAKKKEIELSIYPDQVYYSDSLKHMVIYSRFLDQERRNGKKPDDEQHYAECIA